MKKNIFQDYAKENKLFENKILRNFISVMKLNSEYEHYRFIDGFEQNFADSCGSRYAICVNSGTTALQLALVSAGVMKNDEVILPSYTFPATALAVSNIGARPVFVDIKKGTLTIDPAEIKKNIKKKTKAIIVVHIHGNPCEMDRISEIAASYRLPIIEDASHAHGAIYKNVRVGNFGIGCFSCHTSKIMGAIGNAGIVTINDEKIYRRIMALTNISESLDCVPTRTPCRIDAVQAAILMAKLPALALLIKKRREVAEAYRQIIKQKSVEFQKEESGGKHVYRDFVIIVRDKKKLMAFLAERGIESKIRYEVPLHLTSLYRSLGYRVGDLPVTENIANRALCLPCSHVLSKDEIYYIGENISNFFSKKSHKD